MVARRKRDRNETREKILKVARKLVAEEGHDGVSMRKIAALIEYSPTIIYAHFRDKQNLLSTLAEEGYTSLGIRIHQHADVSNPLRRLRVIAQEFVRFALENPNRYNIITKKNPVPASQSRPLTEDGNDDRHDVNSLIFKTVCEAIQGKLLCSHLQDAEIVAQTFYAGIQGVITMCLGHNKYEGGGSQPALQRVDLMIDTLLHGLGNCQQETPVYIR